MMIPILRSLVPILVCCVVIVNVCRYSPVDPMTTVIPVESLSAASPTHRRVDNDSLINKRNTHDSHGPISSSAAASAASDRTLLASKKTGLLARICNFFKRIFGPGKPPPIAPSPSSPVSSPIPAPLTAPRAPPPLRDPPRAAPVRLTPIAPSTSSPISPVQLKSPVSSPIPAPLIAPRAPQSPPRAPVRLAPCPGREVSPAIAAPQPPSRAPRNIFAPQLPSARPSFEPTVVTIAPTKAPPPHCITEPPTSRKPTRPPNFRPGVPTPAPTVNVGTPTPSKLNLSCPKSSKCPRLQNLMHNKLCRTQCVAQENVQRKRKAGWRCGQCFVAVAL